MRFRILIKLIGFQLFIVSSVAYSSQPLSFLETTKRYVQSYIESNEVNEEQLTKLLRGMTRIQVNIYFRTDSAEVEWRERQLILNVINTMWIYPMINISLGGYADSRGSDDYNMKLVKKRIAAVKQIFKGVLGKEYNPKRFYEVAYGKQSDSHETSDEEGMSLDRRVTIVLLVQSNY